MEAYWHRKVLGSEFNKLILPPLINCDLLMLQCDLFKTCMKSNARVVMFLPFDLNPFTKVWRVFDGNNNLIKNFSEFIKLTEIVVTHVIWSVEDKRTFSCLVFLKSKLRTSLVENLKVVVGMYFQKKFTLRQ